jgi:hypothetical protein
MPAPPSALTLVAENGDGMTHGARGSVGAIRPGMTMGMLRPSSALARGTAVADAAGTSSSAARPSSAAPSRSIHPFVVEVLAVPPPSSSVGLLSATTRLANSLGMNGALPTGAGAGPDLQSEPFRSVMDNTGAWSRSRAASKALVLDAVAVSGAAEAASAAAAGPAAGDGGRRGSSQPMTTTPSLLKKPPRDPLFDVPLPAGCERDPVLRAMLRIQRARVLSAAHLQGHEKAVAAAAVAAASLAAGQGAAASAAGDPTEPAAQRRSSAIPAPPLPPHAHSSRPPSRIGYSPADMDPVQVASSARHVLGQAQPTQQQVGAGATGAGVFGARPAHSRPGSRPSTAGASRPGTAGSSSGGGGASGLVGGGAPVGVQGLMRLANISRGVGTAPSAAGGAALAGPVSDWGFVGGAGGEDPRPSSAAAAAAAASADLFDDDEEPVLGTRALSQALAVGVVPSALDIESTRAGFARAHNDRITTALARKHALVTKEQEELRRAAERESRVTNRAEFNRRQRQLVALIFTLRSAVGLKMAVNDEKARRTEVSRRKRAAQKLCVWWKRILQWRYIKSLEHARKLIKRTMGSFVLRWRTLRLVRAARCVAAFLVATKGMNKQVRTMLAYRDYRRALKRVKNFLVAQKKAADAQVRMVQMRWSGLEEGRREDTARAIADALKAGTAGVMAAPPQLVAVMRLLGLTTLADVAARNAEVQKEKRRAAKSARRGGGGDDEDDEDAEEEARLVAEYEARMRGDVDIMRNTGAKAFDVAGLVGQGGHLVTLNGVSVQQHGDDDGGLGGGAGGSGFGAGGLGSSMMALDRTHGRRRSVDMVLACLPTVPDYVQVPAIRAFLKYRRTENFDAVRAWRNKMRDLAPFHARQRKQLEIVQRLQWTGAPSAFVFDASAMRLPPPPKRFRHIPSDNELFSLIERVSLAHTKDVSRMLATARTEAQRKAQEAAAHAAAELDRRRAEVAAASAAAGGGGGRKGVKGVPARPGAAGPATAAAVPAAVPRKEFSGLPPGKGKR